MFVNLWWLAYLTYKSLFMYGQVCQSKTLECKDQQMIRDLQHQLKLSPSRDEKSRQEFISTLRGYVLMDMAAGMNERYENEVKPEFEKEHGRVPNDGPEVHRALKSHGYFKFYSSIRYNAQEMVWRSVIPAVDRELDQLITTAKDLSEGETGGTLTLDETVDTPKNVSQFDIHLSPGSYHSQYSDDDVATGVIYDNGLNVFAANMMGENLSDIGQSMSNYVRHRFPDFKPKKILDCGCTVGHNTAEWARTYPDAEVTGIDVSAPVLRYAHARAQSQGTPVHYAQMNATQLNYADETFDVVFSSMFLHELPLKDIKAFMSEAYRVLKPGGLLLNMELPPNEQMTPYDSFYLDWDAYYNREPFYKCFRDQNFQELCTNAGFEAENYVQAIMPQYGYMEESSFVEAIGAGGAMNDKTGRLTDGINWFGFGSWK